MSDLRSYGQLTYGAGYYGSGVASDDAAFVVEVEAPAGTWVDVTCDVRTIQIDRGRATALEGFAAGVASLTFANADDRYSAWAASGVWAANGAFRTDVPIRMRMIHRGAVHAMWAGFTDSVIDSWPGTYDAEASVLATDAFKHLARVTLPAVAAVGAGELSGARVGRLLTAAGYTGARAIDAGLAPMAATVMDAGALDALDEVRECEYGSLYVSADGVVTFRQRDAYVTDTRMANVQWRFVDRDALPDALPPWTCYSDLALVASDDRVINSADVAREGGALQHAADAPSVAWYDVRSWTREGLPLAADVDALTLAQAVVAQHANNERRIERITFSAMHQTNGQLVACGVRLLDRVQIVRHTPGGYAIDAELLVQGIHHSITGAGTDGRTAGEWTVTLDTTNARLVRDAGLWDVGKWDLDKWSV